MPLSWQELARLANGDSLDQALSNISTSGYVDPTKAAASPTSSDAGFLNAAKAYNTNRAAATALTGEEQDGSGPLGFLTGALKVLDIPKSVVVAAGSSLLGADDPHGEADSNVLERVGNALGGQSYGYGDFNAFDSDDSTGQKWAKRAAAFGVDTLADPISWLTFGTGTGIKKGAELAARGGTKLATKAIEDAGERAAREAAEGASEAAAEAARVVGQKLASEAVQGRTARSASEVESIVANASEEARNMFVEQARSRGRADFVEKWKTKHGVFRSQEALAEGAEDAYNTAFSDYLTKATKDTELKRVRAAYKGKIYDPLKEKAELDRRLAGAQGYAGGKELKQVLSGQLGYDKRLVDEVYDLAGKRTDLAETSPADLLRNQTLLSDARRSLDEKLATEAFQSELGTAFATSRSEASRLVRSLADEVGGNADDYWNLIPDVARGGAAVAVPFTNKRLLELSKGQGNALTETLAGGRNRIRQNRAFRSVADNLSGEAGTVYGGVVRDLGKKGAAATTFGDYLGYTDANRTARALRGDVNTTTERAITQGEKLLKDAEKRFPDGAVREKAQRYFLNPKENDLLDLDELPDSAALTSADDVAKRVAAEYQRVALANAEKSGLDVENLRDFVPRVITEQGQNWEKAKEFIKGRSDIGDYRATESRDEFYDLLDEIDPDLGVAGRELSVPEINERFRQAGLEGDFFETDPARILGTNATSLANAGSARKFAEGLEKSGAVWRDTAQRTTRAASKNFSQGVHSSILRGISSQLTTEEGKLAAIEKSLNDTLKPDQDAVAELTKARKISEDKVVGLLASQENISKLLADVNTLPSSKQGKAFKALFDSYKLVRENLDDDVVKSLDPEDRSNLKLKRDDWFRTEFEYSPLGQAMEREGLLPVGRGVDNIQLPQGMEGVFGPKGVRDSLERLYQLNKNPNSAMSSVGRVVDVYLRTWKTLATIGRGPGYIARNVFGGVFNNSLMGVSAADHWAGSALTVARSRAIRAADKLNVTGTEWQAAYETALRESLTRNGQPIQVNGVSLFDISAKMDEHGAAATSSTLDSFLSDPRRGDTDAGELLKNNKNVHRFDLRLPENPTVGDRALLAGKKTANLATNNAWTRLWTVPNNASERFLRSSAYISYVRRNGLDDGVAATDFSNLTQFNYQDLSQAEEKIRRFLPFYSWMRNNVPLQVRSIVANPRKYVMLDNAQENVLGAFEDENSEDFEQFLPDWLRRSGSVVTGAPGDSSNPLALSLIGASSANDLNTYFGTPGSSKNPLTGFGAFRPDQVAGATNPLLKAFAEQQSQTDTFTGAAFNPKGEKGGILTTALARIPGLGYNDGEDYRLNSSLQHALKTVIPAYGTVETDTTAISALPFVPDQIAGSDSQQKRAFTTLLSQLLPLQAGTLTPEQLSGELRSRTERLLNTRNRAVGSDEVDTRKLNKLLEQGVPAAIVRQMAEQGLLAPDPTGYED